MPRMKSIFKQIKVGQAGRKRPCKHDKTHVISKGDYVLIIKEGLFEKAYCKCCAKIIIEQAKALIIDLERKTQ